MDNKLNYTEENEEREDGKLSYRTPIYLQLREIIRNRIEEGEYLPGTAIPSENKLAETYGINRLTVRNAVDALVNEGILRRVQGKGVFVVIDIALFGKLPLILANCVPPVFFILEIFLCFFGKLQLVQFVDKIITVIFFAADSGIEPVTVKVLCKVDKVFHASGILAMCNRRRKFILVPVTLHFQKFSKIIQLVHACALDNGTRQVKGAVLRRRIPVDEKILRIVCGNADAFHSRMKLLCCGRHGKPHAARFACFKAAAAVDKN